ncbi:MAG: MFS transporter [Bacteroidia bacterium]
MQHALNDKKITRAWTMYDWANSVFSLTIATAIFPPYYESVSKSASIAQQGVDKEPYLLNFLGFKVVNTALYSYTLSLGFLLVAIITPILSGIADAKQNKKFFMKMFCYLGAASCIIMYFFTAQTIYFGLTLFVISLVGFTSSIVYYNAFLPEIATEDNYDKLSAKGYSLGYVGSVLLLLFNLSLIMFPSLVFPLQNKALQMQQTGLTETDALQAAKSYYESIAIRLSFVSVGLWWAGFAQITFRHLPEKPVTTNNHESIFYKGFLQLKKVWLELQLPQNSIIKRYLWGFFFTSMGLQTVMYVASLFGSYELKLPTQDLIILIIIIQIVAIAGAHFFSWLSKKNGNIYTLIVMLSIWIIICVLAFMVQNKVQFFGIGILVGLVMGGIQSLLRSTYAKIIPDGTKNNASYFSFYDVSEKLAIVFGTFVFGFLLDYTGSMRLSTLAIAAFFSTGMFFIARIKNFKELHP